MPIINVTELLQSTSLLTAEKGRELYNEIVNKLALYTKLTIDFTDYDFLSTSFLNNSFGQLALDKGWNYQKMRSILDIIGLDEDDLDEVDLAVFNAMSKRSLMEKGIDVQEFYAKHLAY